MKEKYRDEFIASDIVMTKRVILFILASTLIGVGNCYLINSLLG